ncbi:MAG: hypothetical protein ABUK01_02065 [Leptospirales bacterium]
MKRILYLTLLYLLFCYAPAIFSSSPSGSEKNRQIVSDYLVTSGFEHVLNEYITMLFTYQENSLSTFIKNDSVFASESSKLFYKYFNITSLYYDILSMLSNSGKRPIEGFLTLGNYQKTKTGKRMTYFENLAFQPSELAKLPEYIESLKNSPPAKNRVNLITRLDKAVEGSRISTLMTMGFLKNILIAVNNALPEKEQTDSAAIDELIQAHYQKNLPEFESAMQSVYLFTYRMAGDDELKKYVEHCESRSARLASLSLATTLLKVFQDVGNSFSGELTKALDRHRTRMTE